MGKVMRGSHSGCVSWGGGIEESSNDGAVTICLRSEVSFSLNWKMFHSEFETGRALKMGRLDPDPEYFYRIWIWIYSFSTENLIFLHFFLQKGLIPSLQT
jgi:hypothetical protein